MLPTCKIIIHGCFEEDFLTTCIQHAVHVGDPSLNDTQGGRQGCYTFSHTGEFGSVLGHQRDRSVFQQLIKLCRTLETQKILVSIYLLK